MRFRTFPLTLTLLLAFMFAFSVLAQTPFPAPIPTTPSVNSVANPPTVIPDPCKASSDELPVAMISAGVSFDYITHQPSANTSAAFKIGSIACVPTYSISTFETANIRFGTGGVKSDTIGLKTGLLQVFYHQPHWGVFTITDGGVIKFDQATLSTFTGQAGVYFDAIGKLSKDAHHGWVAGIFREVSVAGMQVKPVYSVQIMTTFGKN
jgi:hypothetical protein